MPKPAAPAKLALALILIFISVAACSSSSKTSQANLDAFAKSKLGNHYTITYNESNSHALCQQSRSGDHMNRSFKFIIVKVSDRTIVKDGTFRNGYAKWADDKSVEVGSAGANEKIDKKIISIEAQKS